MSRQAEHLTLLDWARLTDEEIGDVSESCWDADHPERYDYGSTTTGHLVRCVADAATAKALWAIVEWLESQNDSDAHHTTQVCLPCMTFEISNLLEEAGIERPRETAR